MTDYQEPTLTIKDSDGIEFYCSECRNCVASFANGRKPDVALRDLAELFRSHIKEHHPHPRRTRRSVGSVRSARALRRFCRRSQADG